MLISLICWTALFNRIIRTSCPSTYMPIHTHKDTLVLTCICILGMKGFYCFIIAYMLGIIPYLMNQLKKSQEIIWVQDYKMTYRVRKTMLVMYWLSLYELDTTTHVQSLDKAVCISHSGNIFGNSIHPTILPPIMSK